MSSPLARAAQWYADRGLSIFPLAPRTKIPLRGSHGYKDGAPDASPWAHRPLCNIALAPKLCGLVVVDLDTHDAEEDLPGPLPLTWRSLTRKGSHHVYRVPEGRSVIFRGIPGRVDICHDSPPHAVLPPSVHPSGHVYRWDVGAHPTETTIADAPAWLVGSARPRRLHGEPIGSAEDTFLARAFASLGMVIGVVKPGFVGVVCPWESDHSQRGGASSSVVIAPSIPGLRVGFFSCRHGHCSARNTRDVLKWLPKSAHIAAALAGYRDELRAIGGGAS